MVLPRGVLEALRYLKSIYSYWENNLLRNVALTLTILQAVLGDVRNLHVRAAHLINWDLSDPQWVSLCDSRWHKQHFYPTRNKSRDECTHFTDFIEIQEESASAGRAHCPSLPRPSAAWVTAFVTVWVTVSVTSFTTLSPVSWAFLKASAMAVRKKRGMSGEQSKCFQPLARPMSPGVACGTWQSLWLVPGTIPNGMQGSKAPGGMCSNFVLFLPVTCFPSAMIICSWVYCLLRLHFLWTAWYWGYHFYYKYYVVFHLA